MNGRIILLAAVVLLSGVCSVFADRQLEEAEIQQILQQLTSQPKKTWIDAGTILATHQEYSAPKMTDEVQIRGLIKQRVSGYLNSSEKPEVSEDLRKMRLDATPFNTRYEHSNEYTMVSNVIFRYDGERFYWETNVESRTDSVKPDKRLAGNPKIDQFNMDWNKKRIAAWDGENYTRYTSLNHAMVDARAEVAHNIGGPLNAGIVPWGIGRYTYDKLAGSDPAAVERLIEGTVQIELTLNDLDGMLITYELDASKDYAVISCVRQAADATYVNQYCNYQLVNGRWVPGNILLEKYEPETERLLKRDLWEITSIDGTVPEAEDFEVQYDEETRIEFTSDITGGRVLYRNSQDLDVQGLLADRLVLAANQANQSQNCATAALGYVLGELDRAVTAEQMSALVDPETGLTSMLAIKQFAQGQGLYCKAVVTDIDALRELSGDCQVILHFSGKKHLVVLESITDSFVKVIDLSSNRFYYPIDISFFDMDWTEGVALIVSASAISGGFTEIAESDLAAITGAGGYSCSKTIQVGHEVTCTYSGTCGGYYHVYFTLFGCQDAESGTCYNIPFLSRVSFPCAEDPYEPERCIEDGQPSYFYLVSCPNLP